MAMRNRARAASLSSHDADTLLRVLQPLGAHAHLSVRAERGHLTIRVDDGDPVARVTPLGAEHYGLRFQLIRQSEHRAVGLDRFDHGGSDLGRAMAEQQGTKTH